MEPTVTATIIEAEVNQSTLTPDTTDNTLETLPATQGQDIVTDTTNVGEAEHETFVIDAELADDLLTMLIAATSSNFYMSNPKRVKLLKEALFIPVSDDKSFTMFYSHSEKDLIAEAYRNSRKNGEASVEVTKLQIIAEAQKRYKAKHGCMATVNEEYMV